MLDLVPSLQCIQMLAWKAQLALSCRMVQLLHLLFEKNKINNVDGPSLTKSYMRWFPTSKPFVVTRKVEHTPNRSPSAPRLALFTASSISKTESLVFDLAEFLRIFESL